MPLPVRVLDDRLERRPTGRPHHGPPAWHLLHRLLWLPHGALICLGGDESPLGSDHDPIGAGGEGSTPRRDYWACGRRRARDRWSGAARTKVALSPSWTWTPCSKTRAVVL